MEKLNIKGLSFKYPDSESYAVEGMNLKINEGELVLVAGSSGCGKTTLLRLIKNELAPFGEQSGEILLDGKSIRELDKRASAEKVGFVMQDPKSQIVTDKVWHELCFGLENIGTPQGEMKRRQGEMASYFGISHWYHRDTDSLSGGQKQLLNLAGVMIMQPEILILDEPTAQLDPVSADRFLHTVIKLNEELGITVIIAEHHLEELFAYADKILLMDNGRAEFSGTPAKAGKYVRNGGAKAIYDGLPTALRIYSECGAGEKCPFTVRQGREYLRENFANKIKSLPKRPTEPQGNIAVRLKRVFFSYEKSGGDILKNAELTVHKGEIFTLLGANGSGKSTTLKCVAGAVKPDSGKIEIFGKNIKSFGSSLYKGVLALLPQDPKELFIKDSVREDYKNYLKTAGISGDEADREINELSKKMDIYHLLDRHPYDLSGGELQKAALGRLLLTKPSLLLLDEPAKGLDPLAKKRLGELLLSLSAEGMTIIEVTHDIEFAARYSTRCGLVFDGGVISADSANEFFSANSFYTTAAGRISKGFYDNAVLYEDVVSLCLRNGGAV